jgi:hypothetical protein
MDLLQYGILIAELSRLLDIKFTPDSTAYHSFLSLSVKSVIELFNKGDFTTQKYELAKLTFLVNSLGAIEANSPKILKKIKKKMKMAIKDHANYLGLRFEINQAYALLSKGVKIEYQDKPDFKVVTTKNYELFFECGSTHFFYEPKGDILDKLYTVIKEKSDKSYANLKTGLFIDVTNLVHMSTKNKIPDLSIKMRKVIESTNNNYGAIILIMYLIDNDRDRFGCNYIRVNNANIDSSLNMFLNMYYPNGSLVVNRYSIPNEG